jgi:hypothetical protein
MNPQGVGATLRPAATLVLLIALAILPLAAGAVAQETAAQETALLAEGAGPAAGTCGEDPFQLFDIPNAAELSRTMSIQADAERFLAGTRGEEGGSVTGRLFADYGVAAEWLGKVGKQGEVASELWGEFSEVVMGSAEAFAHLYPGKMELVAEASPTSFVEDATEKGSWRVGATSASELWNLTDEILQEALGHAMEDASLDPVLEKAGGSIDRSRMTPGERRLLELAEGELTDRVGGEALKKYSAQQLSAFLKAVGATEGPNGFYIPPQCWEVSDGWNASNAGPGSPPAPGGAWASAEVQGDAIKLAGDRGYAPHEAGSASLRIWTVEGRQAFGNVARSTRIDIEVRPIQVDLTPTIQKVEPGDKVPFLATIRDANDKGMAWGASAGHLGEPESAGEGMETSVLQTPLDPEAFPIEVVVKSTSTSGPRRSGTPPREARSTVQLADPVIDIQPSGGCIPVGERRQFTAQVFGVESQQVTWSARGSGDGTIHSRDGWFDAGSTEGTYTVQAAWAKYPDATAEVDIRVAKACSDSHFAYDVSDALSVHEEGEVYGINGLPSERAPGFLEAGPGLCLVQFVLETGTPGISFGGKAPVTGLDPEVTLGLTAVFVGAPREGMYAIGNHQRNVGKVAWKDELANPDAVFAGLSTGMSIDEDGLADRFTSQSGGFQIDYFDGERIEARFDILLEEDGPEHLPTRKDPRHVRVSGRLAHVLNSSGSGPWDTYACGKE